MAMQGEDPAPSPSPTAELVGHAFVEQYYNMLSKSPNLVHKFYQDSSVMSRPAADGMSTVTTMTGIDSMILSLEYQSCEVQILSADSQKSFGDGVIVLVTGFLTGKDGLKRKFTQLFFLAPQDGGFFVLNDVLRYVDEEELPAVKGSEAAAEIAPTTAAVHTSEPEPIPVPSHAVIEQDISTVAAEDTIQVANNEASLQLENGNIVIAEKDSVANDVAETPQTDAAVPEAPVVAQEDNHHHQTAASPNALEDAPKMSYASIANQLNFKPQPFQQRVAPPKPVVVVAAAPAAAPADAPAPRPARNNSVERNHNFTGKGHPIFVANLPMDATPEQLSEIFEKFGPIKPGGVQVRSYKQEKNCFGFVDFESASSMEKALQAKQIMIGNREANIEKKKAPGEGGKLPPRRGGFRNDGFRGRGGSFVGGRGGGYGKGEFENQQGVGGGNFAGQARGGGAGRNGEVKVYQNGGGRGARQARPAAPAAAPAAAAPAAAAVQGGKN